MIEDKPEYDDLRFYAAPHYSLLSEETWKEIIEDFERGEAATKGIDGERE